MTAGPAAGLAGAATGSLGPIWHVGVVVPDLDAAMAELGATLGVAWCDVQERPNDDTTLRLTFSRTAPFIEVIEGSPGTSRDTSGGAVLHHVAYWSHDFDADSARLRDSGFALEVGGGAPFGGRWCYLKGPDSGMRVELCEVSGRAGFAQRWGLDLGGGEGS